MAPIPVARPSSLPYPFLSYPLLISLCPQCYLLPPPRPTTSDGEKKDLSGEGLDTSGKGQNVRMKKGTIRSVKKMQGGEVDTGGGERGYGLEPPEWAAGWTYKKWLIPPPQTDPFEIPSSRGGKTPWHVPADGRLAPWGVGGSALRKALELRLRPPPNAGPTGAGYPPPIDSLAIPSSSGRGKVLVP